MDAGERGEKLWEPSAEAVERSQMTAYMRWLGGRRDLEFEGDYDRLWQWSVAEIDAFWRSIWDYFEVGATAGPDTVLGSREMPGAEWMPGATLNYAEHLFRDRNPAALAIQHQAEGGELGSITWGELSTRVAAFAAGLRELGSPIPVLHPVEILDLAYAAQPSEAAPAAPGQLPHVPSA